MTLACLREHVKAIYREGVSVHQKPAPIRFQPHDDLALELIAKNWRLVRDNLRRVGLCHIAVCLEGTQPVRFEAGKLVLWFPECTTVRLFEHRAETFEPAVAQAIWSVVGVHCGVRATSE